MKHPTPPIAPHDPAKPPKPRTIDSQALFGPAQQVWITHQGETYKLQITRQGKLILTK